MPFYPEDQSDKNLKKIRHFNVCAECGRQLYIYFDLKKHLAYISCPTPGHEGIKREYEPQRVDYQSNIRRETELEQKYGPEASTKLATIPKQGQLTQQQAMHVLKLVYPLALLSSFSHYTIYQYPQPCAHRTPQTYQSFSRNYTHAPCSSASLLPLLLVTIPQ